MLSFAVWNDRSGEGEGRERNRLKRLCFPDEDGPVVAVADAPRLNSNDGRRVSKVGRGTSKEARFGASMGDGLESSDTLANVVPLEGDGGVDKEIMGGTGDEPEPSLKV